MCVAGVVGVVMFIIYSIKKKKADELLRGLVGSEMCISDRCLLLRCCFCVASAFLLRCFCFASALRLCCFCCASTLFLFSLCVSSALDVHSDPYCLCFQEMLPTSNPRNSILRTVRRNDGNMSPWSVRCAVRLVICAQT